MPNLRPEHQEALDVFCTAMGRRVTLLRERQKMTVSEFARMVGFDHGRVREVELGRPIPLWMIKPFAEGLGVTVDVLLYGEAHQLPTQEEISKPVRDIAVRLQHLATQHRYYMLMYLDLILTGFESKEVL